MEYYIQLTRFAFTNEQIAQSVHQVEGVEKCRFHSLTIVSISDHLCVVRASTIQDKF